MGNKGETFPPEPLSAQDVRALLAACDTTALPGIRNRALLVVLWRSGLRCAEALALRPSDIDVDRGTVRVLRGKGRKARTVGIDPEAAAVVGEWIRVRAQLELEQKAFLFCTLRPPAGQPMSSRYVRAEVGRLGVRAGIQHRCHPHGLRHTMAVELSDEGWTVPLISRQLGHSSIATTDVYLAHIYPAEVIGRARARSWQ